MARPHIKPLKVSPEASANLIALSEGVEALAKDLAPRIRDCIDARAKAGRQLADLLQEAMRSGGSQGADD